ncbi:hypothetical protein PWG14_07210 (plasmid) [Chromobacterium amazonense]|uniref:hypothetical protein n=1 Tax=Chromobacterium amazonense TaxID=1382803 RepID=UPI00237ECE25|nr:hypothetical protein [Chromobacterium amazonense]MDE1712496.1 hypothetical protein [Chromobacterium amazonense]
MENESFCCDVVAGEFAGLGRIARRLGGVPGWPPAAAGGGGSEYFDQNNKHLFSTMFPVPRYAWKWQPVNEDSVAHAMMKVICDAAGNASQ